MQRSISKEVGRFSVRPTMMSVFSPDNVARFLQNPSQHEQELRQLSNYFYSINGYYRNIVQYFALMPKDAYVINPYIVPDRIDAEQYKKAYFKNLREIEKFNLRNELPKMRKIAFKEDVYFGYAIENKDSTYFLNLDADYCTISSLASDGLYNFYFDFSYFDINRDVLMTYPDEFIRKYDEYQNTGNQFIELDPKNSICIKVNSEVTYPLLPFSSIFESLFDLDDYEKIAKQRTKMDNFLLLTQKIPMDDKERIDFFNLSPDLAAEFHEFLAESVESMGISVALSPMDIQAVRMERSKNDSSTIAQAQSNIYSDAGVPQQIFGSSSASAAGIKYSVMIAEQISLSVMRQIETWMNRRLSHVTGRYKFRIKMLDITVFNEKEKTEELHKAATVGQPVINDYAASLGMSPLEFYNKAVLENDILGLHDMLQPMKTSYTQSSKDEGGREKMEDEDISESTSKWRESDSSQVD